MAQVSTKQIVGDVKIRGLHASRRMEQGRGGNKWALGFYPTSSVSERAVREGSVFSFQPLWTLSSFTACLEEVKLSGGLVGVKSVNYELYFLFFILFWGHIWLHTGLPPDSLSGITGELERTIWKARNRTRVGRVQSKRSPQSGIALAPETVFSCKTLGQPRDTIALRKSNGGP